MTRWQMAILLFGLLPERRGAGTGRPAGWTNCRATTRTTPCLTPCRTPCRTTCPKTCPHDLPHDLPGNLAAPMTSITSRSDIRRRPQPLGSIRTSIRIAIDAFYRFSADDGWAIASHIALSILMAMFPFLIVVTAIAGFIGSGDLADEVARLIVGGVAAAGRRPDRRRDSHRADHGARRRATLGAVFAVYFASSGVESLRIGLNRAYGLVEQRSWWLLRLEVDRLRAGQRRRASGAGLSRGAGAAGVSRGRGYAPWLEPLQATTISPGSRLAAVVAVDRAVHPAYVVAGRAAAARRSLARHSRDAAAVARLRLRLRPLPRRFLVRLRDLLRRAGLGDDGAGVSLFLRCDLSSMAASSTPRSRGAKDRSSARARR